MVLPSFKHDRLLREHVPTEDWYRARNPTSSIISPKTRTGFSEMELLVTVALLPTGPCAVLLEGRVYIAS